MLEMRQKRIASTLQSTHSLAVELKVIKHPTSPPRHLPGNTHLRQSARKTRQRKYIRVFKRRKCLRVYYHLLQCKERSASRIYLNYYVHIYIYLILFTNTFLCACVCVFTIICENFVPIRWIYMTGQGRNEGKKKPISWNVFCTSNIFTKIDFFVRRQ